MTFSKPSFNAVWASSGEKVAPSQAKISQGWVVEIPPHQYENWIANRQDQMLAHINQYGIAEWDSSTEYQANKSYAQGVTTGNVYRALVTNTGVNPETDVNNNWTIAFERSGLSLLKSQNLADVPDKAQARTNLGIATTADYDNRYLQKSLNLSDIPNKASARNILDVYSKTQVVDLLPKTPTAVVGRQYGQVYTNTTGKYILVCVTVRDGGGGNLKAEMKVDGVLVSSVYNGISSALNAEATLTAWVPPGLTYRIDRFDANDVIVAWVEYV